MLSEQRLQKEHEGKVTRLRVWQKKLEARLTDVLNEVKEFQKKERMSEAQKYVDALDEIQAKIHGFLEEVVARELFKYHITALKKFTPLSLFHGIPILESQFGIIMQFYKISASILYVPVKKYKISYSA